MTCMLSALSRAEMLQVPSRLYWVSVYWLTRLLCKWDMILYIYQTITRSVQLYFKRKKTEGYKFGTSARFTQLAPVALISGRGKGKQNCSVSKMVDHK